MELEDMTYDEECLKCTTCKQYLPVRFFSPSPKKTRRYQYTCLPCRKQARIDKGLEGQKYRKFQHLNHKYGISKEQYFVMIKEQNHKCKICGLDEVDIYDTRLHVDHDHATGKVRGLLCRACNHGIGNFKDSPELLAKAINYLEECND